MTARLLIPVLAATLLVSGPAAAFKNEPTGFRGLKWGTPLAAIKGLIPWPRPCNGFKCFLAPEMKKTIGPIKLMPVILCFWKGKLARVMLIALDQKSDMLPILEKRFGPPKNKVLANKTIYFWKGDISSIFYQKRPIPALSITETKYLKQAPKVF